MKKFIEVSLIVILFIPWSLHAQDRLKSGKMYEPGEDIYAPTYGIKTKVPDGWTGMVPMDTEIFLLMPMSNVDGEMYVFADTANYDIIKTRWLEGLELGNGNVLKSDGNIFQRGDAIASNVILEQKTTDHKGYIEAKCGEYGRCIGIFLISAPQFFEDLKKDLMAFTDDIHFVEPSDKGFYDDFNWKEFLSGRYLASYEYAPGAKSENEIWLCPDGSFRTKLKRSGDLKAQASQFQGKKKGTWETSSIGETGILVLNFKKEGKVEIPLQIDDDRIFLNGRRHFVMFTDECK